MTNVDIAKDMFEAVKAGDYARFLSHVDENATWVIPGAPEIPFAGTTHGLANIKKVIESWLSYWYVDEITVHDIFDKDNKVVVSWSIKETVIQSKEPHQQDLMSLIHFNNRKVVRFQNFFDTLKAVRSAKFKEIK